MRKIALTDIHGCFLSFEALMDAIAYTTEDELYFLGDYIDRGPDSKKVIDLLLDLTEQGYHIQCLAGNHDHAMLEAKINPEFCKDWITGWGGQQTLEGFGVASLDEIPGKYWDFLNSMELKAEVDEFILVHAGLDFNTADPLKDDVNMMYVRGWYDQINYDWLGDRIIVHGHTPVGKEEVESMLLKLEQQQYLDIDAGCFAKHLPGKGYLCAFDMTNRELTFQNNLDDVSSYWEGKR